MTLSRRNFRYALFVTLVTAVFTGAWAGLFGWPDPGVQAQGATTEVDITAYSSTIAQTDDAPTITASGAVAGPGIVAVSRDLLERFPYGSEVEIITVSGQGCGGWVPKAPLTVADTMNARIKKHLDVWLGTTEQALNWGRCRGEIKLVE